MDIDYTNEYDDEGYPEPDYVDDEGHPVWIEDDGPLTIDSSVVVIEPGDPEGTIPPDPVYD